MRDDGRTDWPTRRARRRWPVLLDQLGYRLPHRLCACGRAGEEAVVADVGRVVLDDEVNRTLTSVRHAPSLNPSHGSWRVITKCGAFIGFSCFSAYRTIGENRLARKWRSSGTLSNQMPLIGPVAKNKLRHAPEPEPHQASVCASSGTTAGKETERFARIWQAPSGRSESMTSAVSVSTINQWVVCACSSLVKTTCFNTRQAVARERFHPTEAASRGQGLTYRASPLRHRALSAPGRQSRRILAPFITMRTTVSYRGKNVCGLKA